jgi:hypothetical protein
VSRRHRRHISTRFGVRRKYHLYFVEAAAVNAMKIGITGDLDQRLAGIQQALPINIELAATVRGTTRQEHALHLRFAHIRMRGDWFQITDELRSFVNALKQMDEKSAAKTLSRLRTPPRATPRPIRKDGIRIGTNYPKKAAALRRNQRERAARLWSAVERMFAEVA